jgi:hypothetical protein
LRVNRDRDRPGTILRFDLPDGRVAYGRVLEEGVIAVYRGIFGRTDPVPVGSRDYAFITGLDDGDMRRLEIVGMDPAMAPDDDIAPPSAIPPRLPTDRWIIYHRGAMRPSNEEEAVGLEITASWTLDQFVDRILGRRGGVHWGVTPRPAGEAADDAAPQPAGTPPLKGDSARHRLSVVLREAAVCPGVLFTGICPAGGWRAGPFPAAAWPPSAELETSLRAGPGWELPQWRLHVPKWPNQDGFGRAVDATLEAMVARGALVAWVGREGAIVTPDRLFLPEEMSDGVFAALTFDGRRYGRIVLDEPLRGVRDEHLLELRAATHGLAELPPV